MGEYWINNIISALVGVIVTKLIDYFLEIRGYIKITLGLLFHRNDKVRISCGYLFRIKKDNKYLLIKGNRIEQYQPVGGIYKTFDSFGEIRNKLEVETERESAFYEKHDLRVYVPGKNVLKFIKWFNTGRNRETNVIREFYEELVVPGYLPEKAIIDASIEYIKRAECKLDYSTAFQCKEVLIHNVFEVTFLDDTYIEKLQNSVLDSNNKLIFVHESDITREAVNINGIEAKIGAHSKSIL